MRSNARGPHLAQQRQQRALAKGVGDGGVERERGEVARQVVQPALGHPGGHLRGGRAGVAHARGALGVRAAWRESSRAWAGSAAGNVLKGGGWWLGCVWEWRGLRFIALPFVGWTGGRGTSAEVVCVTAPPHEWGSDGTDKLLLHH